MRTSWHRPGSTVNEIAPRGPLQSKNPLRLVQVTTGEGLFGRGAGQQPPQL
ncbi:hypothetical protein SAMN05428939_2323 [Streptomyces sp. TLI_105]|nr:hypothetical protein SAMN05428939_2323 [Streptomyces sp. TLI_105]